LTKGIPVILFGSGTTFIWLSFFLSILIPIQQGVEGYPSEFSPQTWMRDLQNFDSFANDESAGFILLIFISVFGIFVGLFIMFLGLLVLTTEISTKQKIHDVKRKYVSIVWQVIFSFIPGLDLWIIYRIEKLRLGGIIYSINFASGILGMYFATPDYDVSLAVSIIISIIFAFFVFRWSKDWNAKYDNNSKKLS